MTFSNVTKLVSIHVFIFAFFLFQVTPSYSMQRVLPLPTQDIESNECPVCSLSTQEGKFILHCDGGHPIQPSCIILENPEALATIPPLEAKDHAARERAEDLETDLVRVNVPGTPIPANQALIIQPLPALNREAYYTIHRAFLEADLRYWASRERSYQHCIAFFGVNGLADLGFGIGYSSTVLLGTALGSFVVMGGCVALACNAGCKEKRIKLRLAEIPVPQGMQR